MPKTALEAPPPHLVEAVRQHEVPKKSPVSQEKSFSFSYLDPTGKTWAGDFTSRVPNIGQQIEIAKSVARRSHGIGEGSLAQDVSDLIYTIAYLDTSLVMRPDWANDLESLPFVEIVNGLAGEAMAHLEAFRQRGGSPGSSAAGAQKR